MTSSSAVAKRPCDASCLSVVSFNSTKRRAQSFIVSYIGYRLNHCMQLNAVFCLGVTLKLLVINISSSSHAINKLCRLLPAVSVTINLPRSSDTVLITPSRSQRWQHAMIFGSESLFTPTTPAFNSPVKGGGFPSEYCGDVWYGTRGQSNLTKSASRGAHSRLGVTPGGWNLYHWIPGVGFPISVP